MTDHEAARNVLLALRAEIAKPSWTGRCCQRTGDRTAMPGTCPLGRCSGVAKTLLVRTRPPPRNWTSKRVQFTPDLMPEM